MQDGDSIDQGIILKTFKLSNTEIITPLKTYDFKKETDEEYMEFGLFMSRREYKQISKRLLRGRILSASEGKFVGSKAPYGYRRKKIPHDKGYTLIIVKSEAKVVILIFDMYTIKKMTASDISRYLNSLSIPSPSGGKWTPDAVRRILKNPIYAGFIRYNHRVSVSNMKDGKISIESRTNDGTIKELIFVKGLHPAIISEKLLFDTFDLMKSRYMPPTNKPLRNPLAGLIRCKKCGKILATNTSHGDKRLYCKTLDCGNKGHSLWQVEEKVLAFLENWINDKELYYSENKDENTLEIKLNLLSHCKEELRKLKLKKDNIYDLFEDGTYSKDVFFERNEKVNLSIDNTETQIQILEDEIEKLKNINDEKENFIPNLKKVLESYRNITDTEQKNYLLKSVIDKIYYLKTETGSRWYPANFELWIVPKISKN